MTKNEFFEKLLTHQLLKRHHSDRHPGFRFAMVAHGQKKTELRWQPV